MQLKTLFRRTLISASLTGFILAGLATINSASLDKPSSTGPIEEFADADVATDYVAREQPPNVTHFEPQRASVLAGRLVIPCKSGPHASALRLKIYKVSAI